jgi:hypothetical protein
VAKVTINGEVFDWDPSRRPLSEALAIEAGLQIPYVQYREELAQNTTRAVATYIWLVWHRAGRDVALADMLAGKVEVDLGAIGYEDDDASDPTGQTPAPSSSTGEGTSGSSPSSSA